MPCCRRLRDALDADMEVTEGAPDLQCWFFNKPYTDLYLMHGGTHKTRASKFEIRQRTAVRNPVFVGWHNLEMFAVPPRDLSRYYVAVTGFWRDWEAHRMLCVPSPPVFAYYSGVLGDGGHCFGHLLRATAITEFTITSFVCFIRAAEFGATDLFLPPRLRAMIDEGRVSASDGVLIPLSLGMRDKILERGLLHIFWDCEVEPVSAVLGFARSSELDWTAPDSLGWFHNDFP